jgi:hypothetical protein
VPRDKASQRHVRDTDTKPAGMLTSSNQRLGRPEVISGDDLAAQCEVTCVPVRRKKHRKHDMKRMKGRRMCKSALRNKLLRQADESKRSFRSSSILLWLVL